MLVIDVSYNHNTYNITFCIFLCSTSGEASRKPIKHYMKIQRGELRSTRLAQLYRIFWVTFKCQKVSLTVKESLNIEHGTQHTKYQMDNSIKHQIYPKIKSQCISSTVQKMKFSMKDFIRICICSVIVICNEKQT